jgi:UDP-3-O-[3-hydroxymyristoyl] glucosamine N-acyltransferase
MDDRVRIGKNVRIGEGTVLGALPLIFNKETGARVRPEIKAGLIIEDDVDIGANCVLNLGEETDTIVRRGSMIGHLSSIGHDADIGRYVGISVHVCISGCVKVGKWSYIAPQTVVKPYVKIGEYTMIGMGSVVNKDIPSGVIAYGTPCKVIRRNTWRPKVE